MNEKLFQFIWQFQYFNRASLYTSEGEPLYIEKPGIRNLNQGPDFSEAVIRIGNTRWAGNVELHVLSSDWNRHRHSGDKRYANIILHVVWENDYAVKDEQGNLFPTLVLQHLVPKLMLEKYEAMMQQLDGFPCRSFLPSIDELHWFAWKERLAAERLERKAAVVLNRLQHTRQHWEECSWQLLAANFGIRINSRLFEQVAQTLPFTLAAKHRSQLHQLEALLLGQANLLQGSFSDAYARMLQQEFRFLSAKYKLPVIQQQPAFLRMRPAAFPTVRLAQLAMLVYKQPFLFSIMRETADAATLCSVFGVTASAYWNERFCFDEPAHFSPKHLGQQMAKNLMINTVIPLVFAYGQYTGENAYKDRALQWLLELPAERNRICKAWKQMGIQNQHALDSQALLELTNHYCHEKRCLDCMVGNRFMKNNVL